MVLNNNNVKGSPVLVIVTPFYPAPNSGVGPWGERYKGLYERLYLDYGRKGRAVWYCTEEGVLRKCSEGESVSERIALTTFLFRECFRTLILARRLVMVIAYPCFQLRALLRNLVFIGSLKILRLFSGLSVCVDYVDPPVEMTRIYGKSSVKVSITVALKRMLERSTLSISQIVVTNSVQIGELLKCEYAIESKVFQYIPMGIDVSQFEWPRGEVESETFTLFYGGTIDETRGIYELIDCIKRIRKDFCVQLLCCGRVAPSFRVPNYPWLTIHQNLNFREYVEILSTRAHVGIIPYPHSEWWGRASISKMATYAAAGVPILSTNLEHTAEFLSAWSCGFALETWTDIERTVIRLIRDEGLRLQLGHNARVAAERVLDWERLSKKLERVICLDDTS